MRSSLKTILPLFFCIVGIAFLSFVLGVAALRYDFKFAAIVNNGLEGAQAWVERIEETSEIGSNKDIKAALEKSQINWNENLAYNGYTLLTLHYSMSAFLIDMQGKIVHSWNIPFHNVWPDPPHVAHPVRSNWIYLEKAMAFPNGDLIAIYTGYGDTPYGYGMVKVDRNSKVLWTYNERVHHDFYIDQENGNIYTLVHKILWKPIPGLEGVISPILADYIVTLSPEGKEIDRISLLEAFRDSPYKYLLYRRPKNSAVWDHMHTNTVMKLEPSIAKNFPMFKAGQLLISSRNLDTVAILDTQTHKIIWAVAGMWRGQHALTFLDTGKLLLLDNKGIAYLKKYTRSLNAKIAESDFQFYSRIIEIDPKTFEVTWDYTGSPNQPFYTEAYGRVQRLPNGNTLVTESMNWRVFEIDKEKKVVWDYQLPKLYIDIKSKEAVLNKKASCISPIYDDVMETNSTMSALPISAIRYRREDLPFLSRKN